MAAVSFLIWFWAVILPVFLAQFLIFGQFLFSFNQPEWLLGLVAQGPE